MTTIRRLPLAAVLLWAGCSYLDQRVTDLQDSVLWRWHQDALGVAATAKVGPLELTAGGWYAEWGSGKDTWWQTPGHVMTNHGTGVPLTTIGPLAYGQSWARLLATSTAGNHPGAPDAFDDARSWLLVQDVFDLDDAAPFAPNPRQRIADLFGLEVGAVPLLFGLHLGFNVVEFADFVLGFVWIDVMGDDGVRRPPTLPFVPAPGRDAAAR
ncbi:MAG: hypothetical protein JNL08_19340 [Planctomycetes bacterium]|nr:hypothetical protein [Planctomycetota bacterium]